VSVTGESIAVKIIRISFTSKKTETKNSFFGRTKTVSDMSRAKVNFSVTLDTRDMFFTILEGQENIPSVNGSGFDVSYNIHDIHTASYL
jgi:hypothetical protein